MATDMELAQKELQGVLEPGLSSKANAVTTSKRVLRVTFSGYGLIANEAAANTTSSEAFWRPEARVRLISARLIPKTALAADGTDYAHVMLTQNDDNGGQQSNLARLIAGSSGVGNLAAGVSGAFTVLTASSADVINAGQMVRLTTVKLGSGVAVPICRVQVEYEKC